MHPKLCFAFRAIQRLHELVGNHFLTGECPVAFLRDELLPVLEAFLQDGAGCQGLLDRLVVRWIVEPRAVHQLAHPLVEQRDVCRVVMVIYQDAVDGYPLGAYREVAHHIHDGGLDLKVSQCPHDMFVGFIYDFDFW